jgi:hypothetical protein
MESGLREIDHYLDDFLFAGADKTSNCSKLLNTNADCTSIFVHCAIKPIFLIITNALSKDEY